MTRKRKGVHGPNEASDVSRQIVFRNVTYSYGGPPVLEAVSFQVAQGSFAALLGPNGAGKSTCLELLLGLRSPDSGEILIFGHAPGEGREPIGYVSQRVRIPSGFPVSAAEVVLMGRYGRLGPGRRPGTEDHRRVREALAEVGLAARADDRFSNLSGGQQQRILIARALAGDPRLLLLDEPTAGLDPAARARFYGLVCDLQHARGLTMICASHDIEDVAAHADQLVLLDRTVRAAGPPSDVLASPDLERTYAFPHPHDHSQRPPPE